MNFIIPGYTQRFFSKTWEAGAFAEKWLEANLGTQLKREIQSRGTNTDSAAGVEELNFFGPNVSPEKAIEIAQELKELLTLPIDELNLVDGEDIPFTKKPERAAAGKYCMTQHLENFQGGHRAGLTVAAFATPEKRMSPLCDNLWNLKFININDPEAHLYDIMLQPYDTVLNGETVDGFLPFTADQLKDIIKDGSNAQ